MRRAKEEEDTKKKTQLALKMVKREGEEHTQAERLALGTQNKAVAPSGERDENEEWESEREREKERERNLDTTKV